LSILCVRIWGGGGSRKREGKEAAGDGERGLFFPPLIPRIWSMCVDNRVGHRPPGTITKTVLLPLSLPSRFLSFSQADSGPRGVSRERLGAEAPHQQEKGGPSVPAHLIGNPYAFGLSPGAVMQDARFQPLNLPRQLPHGVPPGGVPEEYLRGFRPYATAEDLRMPSGLPLGLDPATAAAAAAYYHPSYLPHPSFAPYRMDDPFCLSALRSPFYHLQGGGGLPPLHPSAVHMHLQGVRYPGDLTHASLSALQSERLSERYCPLLHSHTYTHIHTQIVGEIVCLIFLISVVMVTYNNALSFFSLFTSNSFSLP
ncbi:unnamed protein product, partial [Oncorhynchus mykiss]